MIVPEGMDRQDIEWLATTLPGDAMVCGYVASIHYIDGEGEHFHKAVWHVDSVTATAVLGGLEAAKIEYAARHLPNIFPQDDD